MKKKIVQEYYSTRAKDYDQQKVRTWKSERGFESEILNTVVDALAGLESKRVLEVGVGSARIGLPLLDKVRPWFIGLDLSRQMLELARGRMHAYKREFELILGDAEHLPFKNSVFEAIVCISTMHYIEDPDTSLTEFSRTLKEKGAFIYGDVAMHDLDSQDFLDGLERALSKAHAKYYRPSEMKTLLENRGLHVSTVKLVPYRKSYHSLMENKGRYFDVKSKAIRECLQRATINAKKVYAMNSEGLTLFYVLMAASKGNKS